MKYLLYIDYEYYGAYVNEQDAIDDGERLDPNGYWRVDNRFGAV